MKRFNILYFVSFSFGAIVMIIVKVRNIISRKMNINRLNLVAISEIIAASEAMKNASKYTASVVPKKSVYVNLYFFFR